MVHLQHDRDGPRRQVPVRCGPRLCLLKGCEKRFSPRHPLSRYCSAECVHAARLWSRRLAGRRYRSSEGGKACRRRQSSRYRERVRQRREEVESPLGCGEGHQETSGSERISCSRPGCYERFSPERRSPLKRFCCALCRKALRRVRQREARWGWRHGSDFGESRWERFRGPPAGFS